MKAKTERSMKQIILQHKGWLLLTIIAMCAYSAGEIMKAQVMKLAIDAAVDTSMALFQKAVILGIVYLLVLWVTYTFDYWCQEKFARKCMISVKNQWFSDIQRKQLCDYDTQESSTYLSHFTVDAMKIEEGYVSKFLSSLEGIIKGVAALGAILSVHYVFVIVIIIGSYLPIFVSLLWQNKMSETQLASSEMNGKMVATLKELLAGFEVNTLFGIKKRLERNSEKQMRLQKRKC